MRSAAGFAHPSALPACSASPFSIVPRSPHPLTPHPLDVAGMIIQLTAIALTGAIDLVHRHGVEWRVLDYKTDVDGGTAALRYAEQGRAYGGAWERISGAAVET